MYIHMYVHMHLVNMKVNRILKLKLILKRIQLVHMKSANQLK